MPHFLVALRTAARRPLASIAPVTLALTLMACGGAGASGSAAAPTVPPGLASAAASLAGGAGTAAVCRDLNNLKSLDYAFGASFSIMQALDAGSKAQTLKDLQAFQAEAPAEIQTAASDLVAFWTALSADPNSVTESDTRFVSAAQTLGAWLAANCA